MTLVEKSYMWATPLDVSAGITSPPRSFATGLDDEGVTMSTSVDVVNT